MEDKIHAMLEKQIAIEYRNAHAYLSYYTLLKTNGFKNVANMMLSHHRGEIEHAVAIATYLAHKNIAITPNSGHFDIMRGTRYVYTTERMFDEILELEVETSDHIKEIHELAGSIGDPDTVQFLDQFLEEHVIEEAEFRSLCNRCNLEDPITVVSRLESELK